MPAPRVAPKRNFVPLHRRRPIQIVVGVVAIALIALVVWRVLEGRGEARSQRRAIQRFENSVNVLFSGLSDTLEEMSTDPGQFEVGLIPPEEFRGKPDQWIGKLREVNVSLRKKEVPSELSAARALSVHSILILLDAAKSFGIAAQVPEGEPRVSAVKNGEALMAHAQSLVSMFQREMSRVKLDLGMISESEAGLDAPVQLPPEEPVPPLPGGGELPKELQPSP